LEKCILSCKDFVNYIVIAIDKTSDDGTEEIAKKYANEVKYFDFEDDFAKIRNFAHEGVKQDWILSLDGHEFIEKHDRLEEMLETDADGLICTMVQENDSTFRNAKIYKTGVQYEGRVHEFVVCKKPIVYADFVIRHDRVHGQTSHGAALRDAQRVGQVPRIMGEEYRKNKKNVTATLHLGMYNQGMGNFWEAIKWYKRTLKYDKYGGQRWWELFNMSLCYLALGKHFRAFWYVERAERALVHTWEVQKLKGMIYFAAGKYEKALDCLIESFHQNRLDQPYKPWGRDNAGTWNLIGECFFRGGKYLEAGIAFGKAAKECENEDAKVFFQKRSELMEKMSQEK